MLAVGVVLGCPGFMERITGADGTGIYHLTARAVHKRRLFEDAEREVWVSALWKAARFSGVEVITHCILSNHFHILVRIPAKAKDCDDAELVARYRALYGEARAVCTGLDARGLAHALAHDPPDTAEALRERLLARMGDVSEFMRTLQQRYTLWYNRSHNLVGTLWAERFSSVLVEDCPWVVALVAAYIDLNPVRAGLAELPEHYRWSGYTQALAGHEALRASLAACFPREADVSKALAQYRLLMLGKGAASRRGGGGGRVDRAALLEAIRKGGELEAHELLQLKAAFFTRGRALGTQAWMETGGGAKALRSLRRPPAPVPIDWVEDMNLAVAHRRSAHGVEQP